MTGILEPRHASRVARGRNGFWAIAFFRAALFCLLTSLPVRATNVSRFTHFSSEVGLSQNTVLSICQDRAGFLWFGTEEGLNRFDGYSFKVFRCTPNVPGGLSDDVIMVLFRDRQGQLWVGTGEGLDRYDERTETFTQIPDVRGLISFIDEDRDGRLCVGVEGGGVLQQNAGTGKFTRVASHTNNPSSLADPHVSCSLRDRAGRRWIGTHNCGLELMTSDGSGFTHFRQNPSDPASLAHDNVWGLAEDPQGNIWVATYGGGLSVLDPDTGKFRNYGQVPGGTDALPTNLLTGVWKDATGNMWIGTDGGGLLRYDAAADRFIALQHELTDAASLSQNVVRSLYQDRQGQIWVGTYLGGVELLKCERPGVRYFTQKIDDPTSLTFPSVVSFLEDRDGRVWIGTERGGINLFKPESGTFERYFLPSDQTEAPAIMSLFQDSAGRYWAGTYHAGLALFDPEKGIFTSYRHKPGDRTTLSDDDIWTFAHADNGALWVGTSAGVDRFDPNTKSVTRRLNAQEGNFRGASVSALDHDLKGGLWISGSDGLALLPAGAERVINFKHEDGDLRSLSRSTLVAVRRDLSGRMWIGTQGGGLNRLDLDSGVFSTFQGFPSNVIHRIEEGRPGQLWLSTNRGLAQFDTASGAISAIDPTNGLQGLQFNAGASLRSKDGHLYFGSTDGFCVFDPAALQTDTFAPPIVLTNVRIFNEPLKLPTSVGALTEITFSHRDQVVSFEMAALDFSFPRCNEYSYQLEGFSDRWVNLGMKREVVFTNLAPGNYTFRVRASNRDGVWSDRTVFSLHVVVLPAFWATWWFRTAGVVVFFLILLTTHRRRVSRVRRHARELQELNAQLERRVLARTTELAESYQTLRQTQDKLMDASRKAGMAEVATGVLHDLGNAFNSVSVSSALVVDCVRDTKIENLEKVAKMLSAQGPQLARYLAEDPRGQKVAAYLTELSRQLQTDQQHALAEIETLRTGIQRIENIIAAQQTHVQTQTVLQTLSAEEVVEEALLIEKPAIDQQLIAVVRKYRAVSPVRVDRQSVLQILINLFSNAREAVDESKRPDGEIVVGIRPSAPGFVQISVSDNGVGVPVERQTAIFSAGYTTKHKARGFGLHHCALAARTLGGSLSVYSEGLGRGVTFTLELPADPKSDLN